MQGWTPLQSIRQARNQLPKVSLQRRALHLQKVSDRSGNDRTAEDEEKNGRLRRPISVVRHLSKETGPRIRVYRTSEEIGQSNNVPTDRDTGRQDLRGDTTIAPQRSKGATNNGWKTKDVPAQPQKWVGEKQIGQHHKMTGPEAPPHAGKPLKEAPSGFSSRPSRNLPRPPIIQETMPRRGKVPQYLKPDSDELEDFSMEPEEATPRSKYNSNSGKARAAHGNQKNIYRLSIKRSLKQNLREAPFSTLFNHNPFAHALAAPVREDCFTGAHLPNSCLLEFHMVETGQDTEEASLLPISLAAELISKKKDVTQLTPDEQFASMVRQQSESFEPEGSASYISGTEAAVRFVTQDPKKRVAAMVLSRRIHSEMTAQKWSKPPNWRKDMPSFVLEALRKVVAKRLQWLFSSKTNKDNPGMAFEILRGIDGADLSRLNDTDEPSCVIQLKDAATVDSHDTASTEKGVLSSVDGQVRGNSEEQASEAIKVAEDQLETLLKGAELTTSSEEEEIASEITESSSEDQESPEDISPLQPRGPRDPRPKSKKRQTGWWTSTVNRSLHAQTHALPPPLRPILSKYPTLLFRNRSVPIYNLPQLVGEEKTLALVKGTVFEGSRYVALGIGKGTVSAHVWLLRLQMYLAGERSYKALRRERQWAREWVGEGEQDGDVEED